MKTQSHYIQQLRLLSDELVDRFGVRTLRIFGSVARNEQTAKSDIDICVETDTPNPFLLMDMKEFLESLFHCPVDLVRYRPNMNPYLKRQIETEGICVIQ